MQTTCAMVGVPTRVTSHSLIFGLLITAAALCCEAQTSANLNPVAAPTDPAQLHAVERVPRASFGVVGAFPLTTDDLKSLVYPSTTGAERQAVMEGLTFFTTPHTAAEGLGPVANQKFCLGCHMNSAESVRQADGQPLVSTSSQVSRGARATPTNFDFVGLDPATGGGRPADSLDALRNTGRTAAFTVVTDIQPATGTIDGLTQFSSNSTTHTRPSLAACLPDPLPPFADDPNLSAGVDPVTHLSPTGFRRAIGERSGPPYIGRGLIEAVAEAQIIANETEEKSPINTSINVSALFPECSGNDCISGRHNENTSNNAFVGGDPAVHVGRFGVRAAGPFMLQFVVGGALGELNFTSPLNPNPLVSFINTNRPGCVSTVPSPEVPESTSISLRALLRVTAPPEFGTELLDVLRSSDPKSAGRPGSLQAKVRRGAELFGVDLVAFGNRVIAGRMPAGGDGLDDHAINQDDRKVNCAGCHMPVTATGQLPTDTGTSLVNNVWAPLFSDLLLHQGPTIDGERTAPVARLPVLVSRQDRAGKVVPAFDLPRSLADDGLPHQNSGLANGREFRSAPLIGIGRIGAPFLHDGRVFLSNLSVAKTPASTVYSDADHNNAPLVVQSLDDALRAAIELHDLPAPDEHKGKEHGVGGGCPLPTLPPALLGGVSYPDGVADICPAFGSALSQSNRGDAREVIARYRSLSASDQDAIVEFLKQL
jgi:Di-haem oxidoreductase, putative peroxidase